MSTVRPAASSHTERTTLIRSRAAVAFRVALVGGVLSGFVAGALRSITTFRRPPGGHALDLLFWTVAVAASELLPVPVTQKLRLTLSFPILLAVGMLYPPIVVAVVTLIGGIDPREPRREVSLLTAMFNHCQLALAFFAASIAFHALATMHSALPVLLTALIASIAVEYGINVLLVVAYMYLVYQTPVREIVGELRVGALSEFLLSYVALGFVGVVIARLYQTVGFWSVAAFILPLVFARQMFFRSMALEEASKELKDREQVLRALSNRMAEERQDERMQIAGYLHDDLAQQLFRLTLQTEMAKKRLSQGDVDGVTRDLENILTTKQETSDMVRALIRDLHRSPIGRKGLAEAIRSFAADMSRGGPTQISTELLEVSLPPPIQLLIYQIVREATMNALKHANAEHIYVSLAESGDGVELVIRDDGQGFDTSAPQPEGHFGSVMMKERALVAGGTYSRTSEIGAGTTVRATFPRVWVEEGERLESANEEAGDGNGARAGREPPTGATSGPVSAELHKSVARRSFTTQPGERSNGQSGNGAGSAANGDGGDGHPEGNGVPSQRWRRLLRRAIPAYSNLHEA